jgi:hypothetical protein
VLSHTGGQFQVAIGDRSRQVGKGDQLPLHVVIKLGAPQQRLNLSIGKGDKMDASHSQTRCILGPQGGRVTCWNQLSNPSWSASHVGGEPAEVLKDRVENRCQSDPRSFVTSYFENLLQYTEQAAAAWNGQDHGS